MIWIECDEVLDVSMEDLSVKNILHNLYVQ